MMLHCEISVLINNYNYGHFIKDAIQSVLSQDFSDFELIIVDDGSTDNSREMIDSFNDPRIKCIYKENGGQLSAFNAGITIAKGDICCFLDADDMYSHGYLKAVASFFRTNAECGCLFASVEYIGNRSGKGSDYAPGYIGCNPFSAAVRHVWTGIMTSACSIRRSALLKFMPYTENEKYWKTRADDLLIWGADMVGAVKYALDGPKIQYRIHNNNFFANGIESSTDLLNQRKIEAERFCRWVIKQNNLSYSEMLKEENYKGSLSFISKSLSWLKLVRDRMAPIKECIRCGIILLCGIKIVDR